MCVWADPCCPRNLCLPPWVSLCSISQDFSDIQSHSGSFAHSGLFCAVLWQLSIKIPSCTEPRAVNLSWHADTPSPLPRSPAAVGSARCHPPVMLLPVFSICWTSTLYRFHSHFFSIMESFYLTTLLTQFLPLCNFMWMLSIQSRTCFKGLLLCVVFHLFLLCILAKENQTETDFATCSYSCYKTAYSGKSILHA